MRNVSQFSQAIQIIMIARMPKKMIYAIFVSVEPKRYIQE